MLKISNEELIAIRAKLADADIVAAGYNVMVRPIPATQGLEGAEVDRYETLNRIAREKGTEVATKSDDQKSRETHGSDVGVVSHVGEDAYSVGNLKDCTPWAEEGDIVIFPRYCGHCCEMPPGSGIQYHFMADDDLKGKYEGIEL